MVKTKSFQAYAEKRLGKKVVKEIGRKAALEVKALRALQHGVASVLDDYMKKHEVGFDELAQRLAETPARVAKIQKGEVNLTIASIARIFALLGQTPQLSVKSKKS